jgi:formate/nitrite transporter FocA (FNT family)
MANPPSKTPDKAKSGKRKSGTSRSDATTKGPGSGQSESAGGGDGFALSHEEKVEVEEKRPPRAAVLHEIVRSSGAEELKRTVAALAWSSLAAGLSMGFSMLARGVLHRYVGNMPGGFLIESLGYPLGFLLVILSRQQLFTENVMTAVLPVMTEPSLQNFRCFLRLWSVVLLGNLLGVTLFAYGLLHLEQFDAATQKAFVEVAEALMVNSPWQMFTKGILAGWLISMMVWMLAAAEKSRFAIILMCTYVIAIGGFTHAIVGSVEAMYLVFAGRLDFVDCVTRFALPTLAGNIVGGSLIFALISHAQVRSDGD